MKSDSPFLDVQSFVAGETAADVGAEAAEARGPAGSPFLSLYGYEVGNHEVDPGSDQYLAFLNELYDDEFDEALSTLVDEATAIYETNFSPEREDPQAVGYQAERLLNQHFAPLVAEGEAMFAAVARELGTRDPSAFSQEQIDNLLNRYQPSVELSPSFEQFFGKLKSWASKAVDLAKKGISAAAKLGLGPILDKLKGLIKPLLQRVIQSAIGKLPPNLQPYARQLADRLPFLKEYEESDEALEDAPGSFEVSEIQNEFNQRAANLLFADNEVEQDLELARVHAERSVPDTYPVADLDRARERFAEGLQRLQEGEDPAPLMENFIPAILPALRIGIKLIGRPKVVSFLAKFLARLIQKFIGPQYAPALSQAIVDAGLRILQMEAGGEDESRAAASAVAATVEETVRRVAGLPDYVLDNQEVLEGFALQAFEQAAAANLPPVLPEAVYRKRPELREHRRGLWYRRRHCRYKKRIGPKISVRLTPHTAEALETLDGDTVGEVLEEQYGLAPGEEVEANVHLYETLPGGNLSHIARNEELIPRIDGLPAYDQFYPLTREAASLLLDEPDLGREAETYEDGDPNAPAVGQRFYFLEIPGKRPLAAPGPTGRTRVRRKTQAKWILDFPKNEIRVYVFLSEIRAQEVAVKLRQNAHIGPVIVRFRRIIQRSVRKAFAGNRRRLKVIHDATPPGKGAAALRRLPSVVLQALQGRLVEWAVKGVADQLKQRADEFTKAAEDTADGVTVVITLENPPGFPQLRDALKAQTISIATLNVAEGAPNVKLKIYPGHKHE